MIHNRFEFSYVFTKIMKYSVTKNVTILECLHFDKIELEMNKMATILNTKLKLMEIFGNPHTGPPRHIHS